MESGIYDAHYQPAARVYHSVNQSLTNITPTNLAFNSERFDTDTIHDTVTNNSRLTCKTAGKYQITGQIEWAANATGYRTLTLLLNGSTLIGLWDIAGSTTVVHQAISALYDLAVNDYVELQGYQNSGGALAVVSAANYSPEFMMCRVA